MNTRESIEDLPLPSLIVFGPSTSWPSTDFLRHIRHTLLHEQKLSGFTEAIRGLPQTWLSLVDAEPTLSNTPGLKYLESLSSWLQTGCLLPSVGSQGTSTTDQGDSIPPNILLSPLTVIIHIVQYFEFLNLQSALESDARAPESPILVEGFCTGLLAAQVVACSPSQVLLVENGCRALRLAAAIGAFVDLNGIWRDPPFKTSCIVARWSSTVGKEKLERLILRAPGAFVSVISDDSSVTITLPENIEDDFLLQSRAANVQTSRVYLRGSWHTPGNQGIYEALKDLGKSQERFSFPTSRDSTHCMVPRAPLPETEAGFSELDVLGAILLKRCDWATSIARAVSALPKDVQHTVLVMGLHQCIPTAIIKDRGLRVVASSKYHSGPSVNNKSVPSVVPTENTDTHHPYGKDAIAIVGMGCRFPDSDSLEQFWSIIKDGCSTLSTVPETRFKVNPEDVGWKYDGNFIREPDVFDHRFFNISAREAASMDPQQRLALQVAYEALEASGYFRNPAATSDRVGCYLGVTSVEYQDNVDSNPPGAFSLVGSLRAFIAGRISHYFGWTGPSLTFDTACSSSLVAIHNACKDIRSGECDVALAGGVNVMTSPFLFDTLGAANFTSRTGASKPFDNDADGYCRGEGCGLVVLKRLSDAAGDKVLAVIPSSAVNQSENSTPITVPHSGSQAKLYQQVTARAGVAPSDVTYLEAHGTGTPKGDPIEMSSIQSVFGDKSRRFPLVVGSVKANIGHLEAASGAAALIKTVLMTQKNIIPPLAHFKRLNKNIMPLEGHGIQIATEAKPWDANWKAACVNNYGASGSNACVLVCQPPSLEPSGRYLERSSAGKKELFHISARTKESLVAQCNALDTYIAQAALGREQELLANLAFNLAYRHNPAHPYSVTLSTSSLAELRTRLNDTAMAKDDSIHGGPTTRTPVVLCFGGQTKDYVALSKNVYDDCALLQEHLRRCEAACTAIGQGRIFPHVFSPEPIPDLVDLHCCLFAVQYSCAKAWMDSGLVVDALIGHSFGQFTALCISGVLSLEDTLSYICQRARLIQEAWGPEKGAMMSVDAEKPVLEQVVAAISARHLEMQVACYNSPTTYVLSGSREAIAAIDKVIREMVDAGQSIQCRHLDVTHGYHSHLVHALTPSLRTIAQTLTFSAPSIPVEICSEQPFQAVMTAADLASHSRQPVFFTDAVLRLASRLGSAAWIEAGTSSGIITLVKRNLAAGLNPSRHIFMPIHLETRASRSTISDATATLLQAGIHVRHWAHHPLQNDQYAYQHLPAYQFEKHRHWLDYKPRSPPAAPEVPALPNTDMVRLIAPSDKTHPESRFSINTASEEFIACTKGHAVLGTAICPASLYMEMATRAAHALAAPSTTLPHIQDLKMFAPLSLTSTTPVELHTTRLPPPSTHSFTFSILTPNPPTTHASGTITLRAPTAPALAASQRRYARLLGVQRCRDLLHSTDAESVQGRLVYDCFAPLVQYHACYRGLRRVAALGGSAAGLVRMPASEVAPHALTHALAVDNFTQVAGFFVNVMRGREAEHALVCTAVEEVEVYAALRGEAEGGEWLVYCTAEAVGKHGVECDVYVFDADTGALDARLAGVQFASVRTGSLRRLLGGQAGALEQSDTRRVERRAAPEKVETRGAPLVDVEAVVRDVIADMMQVPHADILPESLLPELGIDSLVGIELVTELSKSLGVKIPGVDFAGLDTVRQLCSTIETMVSARGTTKPATTRPKENAVSRSASQHLPISAPATTTKAAVNGDVGSVQQVLSGIVAELLDLDVKDIDMNMQLEEAGMDSLLSIELLSEANSKLHVSISSTELAPEGTFGDLVRLAQQHVPRDHRHEARPTPLHVAPAASAVPNVQRTALPTPPHTAPLESNAPWTTEPSQIFADMRDSAFSQAASVYHLENFLATVHPAQSRLVLSYVLAAFNQLGCALAEIPLHAHIPTPAVHAKHTRLLPRLMGILKDAGLISIAPSGSGYVRTDQPIPTDAFSTLYEEVIEKFPAYTHEHQLLHATGSHLGACLAGEKDALQIVFGENKQLSVDVYARAPLFAAATHVLTTFLSRVFASNTRRSSSTTPIRILELGAGTGGTTAALLAMLDAQNVPFEYTFSDISASFLPPAKRRFAAYGTRIVYRTLDIESPPPAALHGVFDVVLASNCVHATRDLRETSRHCHAMLRPDGMVCLVELTRGLAWMDLVFGLMDGWWRFSDDREYALVDEWQWETVLRDAGFAHVDWSGGGGEGLESTLIRVVLGCKGEGIERPRGRVARVGSGKGRAAMETVRYGRAGGVELFADVYYPEEEGAKGEVQKRPVALLIHGGGHIMLSRTSIPPSHLALLLDQGFLPVAIDYRLCPEVALEHGAMEDVLAALAWARARLPTLALSRRSIRPDGDRVVAVGWSTGGMLAMSLGWTAAARKVRPPDAVLAFYSPTNYADAWWTQPVFPNATEPLARSLAYAVRDGVCGAPLTAYHVDDGLLDAREAAVTGGWMALGDGRSRLALHMNWRAQTLPVLTGAFALEGGAANSSRQQGDADTFAQPAPSAVSRISPHAQIELGAYTTPTCLVHGSLDDLIPVSQVRGTFAALQKAGVASRLVVVEGAGHLFGPGSPPQTRDAVRQGYAFVRSFVCP